ncbi:MAG: glycosyltransferase family 4 protein [Myxococcales bacterium]
MNILVLHEIDYLKKVVYEVHDIPELLAARGHHVTFIDYEEHWERRNKLDLVRFRTEVVNGAHRAFDGEHVELRRPGLVKLPVLDRLSSVPSQFLEIRRTLRSKPFDVVFLYSLPTSGLSAIWLARRAGVPVVFRSIEVLHRLRPFPVSSAIWLSERLAYPRVDRIVALTPHIKDYVSGLGAQAGKIDVLLPGIDPDRFHPEPKDPELMKKYGLGPQHRIVMFLGTMYDFAGLDEVIASFPRVLAAVPQARLLLVGGGGVAEQLRRLAKERNLEKEGIFTGFADYDRLPRRINCADVTIDSFRDELITRHICPGKVPQYLACGKPMVATPLPGLTGILSGEQDGVLFRELGPAFMDGLVELLTDDERRRRLGENAFRYVQENHRWDRVIDRLEGIFQQEIDRKKAV